MENASTAPENLSRISFPTGAIQKKEVTTKEIVEKITNKKLVYDTITSKEIILGKAKYKVTSLKS